MQASNLSLSANVSYMYDLFFCKQNTVGYTVCTTNFSHTLLISLLSLSVELDLNMTFFYLNIYPSYSQESDEGAIHRVNNYPDLLPEMPRYCCPLIV